MEYLYQAGSEQPSSDSVGPDGGAAAAAAGAIFLSGGGQSDLSQDNEPILYIGPNRTSAIDDIRSVVIYIFIITIFFTFFLILPGIRSDKFPTFLCITTSLVVTSIVLIALFGTTWHVGETPISAPYKAFSRDRIQGELSVRIGFQSVNISLVAHKYYKLHTSVDENVIVKEATATVSDNHDTKARRSTSSKISDDRSQVSTTTTTTAAAAAKEAPKAGRRAEVEAEEHEDDGVEVEDEDGHEHEADNRTSEGAREPRSASDDDVGQASTSASFKRRRRSARSERAINGDEHNEKRVNLDINYNERFYWIEPNQMRQEYRHALERGLPYPILTVVEYLSQDEAGFSWSRQYRAAGYYSSISLWLSVCMCILMFSLHCAAPRYGVYAMQALGCLLLFTNLTYALLVPRGKDKLVILFEGQSLSFRFGWNFWLVLVGGNYNQARHRRDYL